MKKIKNIPFGILILLKILIISNVQAQNVDSPIHERIIPPSPEASNLGKYSEATINYHTGTPNIAIPIHTIQGKDISHSVSMTYDASGRKAAEVASWVGLGWTLQAEGVITRTVRGLPDEHPNGYFTTYSKWKNDYEGTATNPQLSNPKNNFLLDCFSGVKSMLPDVYSFNFNGHQGQIMFDGLTKEPVIVPHKNYKVERTFNSNSLNDEWKITTPDGTIYNFENGDTETTTGGPTLNFISTWYLSSIENYNETEKIVFNYGDYASSPGVPRYSVSSATYQTTGTPPDDCYSPVYAGPSFTESYSYKKKYLQSISYSLLGNQVSNMIFSSSKHNPLLANVSARTDQTTNYAPDLNMLGLIQINDLISGSVIKTFDLEFDYFNDSKKLKLESIQEIGKPAYTFEYLDAPQSGGGGSTVIPPDYETFAIDHWGYHNFRTGNSGLIPQTPAWITNNGQYVDAPQANANRNSSGGGATYNQLIRINYPTGGYANYEYESHTLKSVIENYKEYGAISLTAHSNNKSYTNGPQHGTMSSLETGIKNMIEGSDANLNGQDLNVRAMSFTITEAQDVRFHKSESSGQGVHVSPTAILYEASYTSWDDFYTPINYNGSTYLPAGDYILATIVGDNLLDGWTKHSVDYYIVHPSYNYTEIIGGARVRKITLNDGAHGNPDVTYDFRYITDYVSLLNANNLNTNVAEPHTSSPSLKVHDYPQYYSDGQCGNLVVSAYNINPFAKTLGSHIGYNEVAVIKGGIDNGISIYKYSNGLNPNFRSQPTGEEHYKLDDAGTSLEKVKETTFEYISNYYSAHAEGLKVGVIDVMLNYCWSGGTCQYYNVYDIDQPGQSGSYNYSSYFIGLAKKTETTFDQAESQSVVTEYKYEFAENELLGESKVDLPTLEIVQDASLNRSTYKRYNYLAAYTDLKGQTVRYMPHFLISTESGVIEQTGPVDIYKKTAEQISYPTAGQTKFSIGDIVELEPDDPLIENDPSYSFEQIFPSLANTTDDYEITASYQYDPVDINLTEVELKDGVIKTYIWGYDGMYPVAQIIGATYAEVISVAGLNLTTLKTSSTQSAILNQVNIIRNDASMADAQVTAYTYQPNVGIEIMIDPNGRKTEYVYDDLNRLKYVKDHDGSIIKMNEYKYKN